MLPSSTVENYLKAIYLGVNALSAPQRLMPMGQLAASLNVAPGTATTMVKTLAESGLVEYEPYAGVALTPAGERLAALVLRRHRLVELFLVRVMGYAWDEVHDEAEQLEHVVSDRLIERMDEMLGRPEADPHGDPIPNAEGLVKAQAAETLLTCPLHTRVTVTRVIDQDRQFLRFLDRHHLKPGESVQVDQRDAASETVSVRGRGNQEITIGMRAAAKLLVQIATALALLVARPGVARAQVPASAPQPFAITDNAMLIEEAFNQEPGVVQSIFLLHSNGGEWEASLTQEWPIFSRRHQFSYSLSYDAIDGASGLTDTQLHYRIQVLTEHGRTPAFSPRVTLFAPTGRASSGLGAGNPAWQVNLPFSKQAGDVYYHWNAGFTHSPAERIHGASWNLLTPHAGGSAIWRARPMFHLMLEALSEWREEVRGLSTVRSTALTVSPAFRTGWNHDDAQTVIAIGMPLEKTADDFSAGLFVYLSYELPFAR